MLPVVVAVAALSQVVSAHDLVVRTVNLKGDPVPAIEVRIGDIQRQSNSNGIATFENNEPLPQGSFYIRVNLQAGLPGEAVDPNYIGRVKKIHWQSAERFAGGFVIPLWELGDVRSLATAVVTNPTHYAVVLRGNEVLATYAGDVEAWIEKWAPDVPAVSSPYLARSLYAAVQPGETVPEHFADEMAEVYREVERIQQATRECLLRPDYARTKPSLPATAGPATPTPADPTPPPAGPSPTPAFPTPGPGNLGPAGPDPAGPQGPVINYDPPVPVEPEFEMREVTTYKQVWETEYQDKQTVVRRAVTDTVMQNREYTVCDPVTTMQTEYVDQGGYVDQVVCRPGTTRNRLRWQGGGYAVDPLTGGPYWRRGGFFWTPVQSPGTQVVQRQYVPYSVAVQRPITTCVQRVVTRQEPVQVTRYVDEVVTEKVPVQVRKMVAETKMIQVPRNAPEIPQGPAPAPIGQAVYDDAGWVKAP